MMNGMRSMSEAIERIKKAEDQEVFQREIGNLKSYMKSLGMSSQELFKVESRAYYPQNEYSDKNMKENMEKAKERVISYIEQKLCGDMQEEPLLRILNNFYFFLESLLERKTHKKSGIQQEQLAALKIKNEYDIQHLLYACIRLFYPGARVEVSEDTGYSVVRTDIFLDSSHVIEVKCTRENMKLKRLIEEIEADMVHYSAENIYFFLYDKEKIIDNPIAFKESYERKIEGKNIHIIIQQPQIL